MRKISTAASLSPAARRIFERLKPGGEFFWTDAPKRGEIFQVPVSITDDMTKLLNEFLDLLPKGKPTKRKARRR